MKLSSTTLEILKNFSTINPGLYFKTGKRLVTVSPNKNILAESEIEESIPQEFGVYDLNNLLQIISLDKSSVELEFEQHNIVIKSLGGRSKIKYRFAAKEMLVTPPDKKLSLPSVDCKVTLSEADFNWVMKTSAILQSPNIAFMNEGSGVHVISFDAKDDSKSTNSMKIAEDDGNTYKFVFKTENLKMIPGSYEVEISKSGVSKFTSKDRPVVYWVSLESK